MMLQQQVNKVMDMLPKGKKEKHSRRRSLPAQAVDHVQSPEPTIPEVETDETNTQGTL